MDPKKHTLAYVLRLWRATNGEPPLWRAALQDLRTGERRGFPGLDEVVRYLEGEMQGPRRSPTELARPGQDSEDTQRR